MVLRLGRRFEIGTLLAVDVQGPAESELANRTLTFVISLRS